MSATTGPSSSATIAMQIISPTSTPSSGAHPSSPVTTPPTYTQHASTPASGTPAAKQAPFVPRQSTPSTPTSPLSRSPTTPLAPTFKSPSKRKRMQLSQCSHIAIATWIGIGITIAGFIVMIYYASSASPGMRLAAWTARNDFREACKSDLEAMLPITVACNETLNEPPQPPPIRGRQALNFDPTWTPGLFMLVASCTWLVLERRRASLSSRS